MNWRRIAVSTLAYSFVAGACFLSLRAFMPVRVSGGSMHPALHSGDLVFVSNGARATPGDIALIQQPGHGPVLHRVVRVGSDGALRTKGDANGTLDIEPVEPASVRGVVVGLLPVGALVERWRRE